MMTAGKMMKSTTALTIVALPSGDDSKSLPEALTDEVGVEEEATEVEASDEVEGVDSASKNA